VTDLMLALRREGLATVPLTDRVERTMVLAHRREPAPQPGVRAVIDAIRQSVTPGRAGSPDDARTARRPRSGADLA
jgi:hypothetical protein